MVRHCADHPSRSCIRCQACRFRWAGAPPTAPLFVVTYLNKAGLSMEQRISGQRIWKVVRAAGKRAGISALHPHALRHACGAELLRRTKNLRLVQEQLRHADVQTTTYYTKITQEDIREGLETLDGEGNERKIHDRRNRLVSPSRWKSSDCCPWSPWSHRMGWVGLGLSWGNRNRRVGTQ